MCSFLPLLPGKLSIRNCNENPNVEILAYAGSVSVRCFGMVNFSVEEDVKQWIYDNNPVLQQLYTGYDKLEYFRLPTTELDYYDLDPTPPTFLHYDLMSGEVGNGYAGEKYSP